MRKNYDPVSVLLTDKLIELMNREDYESISISKLCDAAGVGRMSFYRNFHSKDDILVRYIASVTYDFIKNENMVYSEPNLREYIIRLFRHLEKNKTICLNLFKIGKIHIIKNIFDEVFLTCGRYNEYKAYYIAGSLYNVFYCWVKNDFKQTPEEIAGFVAA